MAKSDLMAWLGAVVFVGLAAIALTVHNSGSEETPPASSPTTKAPEIVDPFKASPAGSDSSDQFASSNGSGGVDPNPPASAYATNEEADRAWNHAQRAFFAAPGNAGLLASEAQRRAFEAALAAVFQEAKGQISYVETLNRAKARVAPSGGYVDRAEALHRAEMGVNTARAAYAAQTEASHREQVFQQEQRGAEANLRVRRQAQEAAYQAERRATEAESRARTQALIEETYARPPAPADYYGSRRERDSERRHRVDPPNTAPRQFQDYNGNTYTQPHGSTFATDNRTGKQCFVNGDFVHCD